MKKWEIWLVDMEPAIGTEIKKKRPCIILSPDFINERLGQITIIPMTTKRKYYPFRVQCKFNNTDGEIMVEQIKSFDKTRFIKRFGTVEINIQKEIIKKLTLFIEGN